MKNLLFGSSGSLGSSIIKIISKKYKKKRFIYIARSKPLNSKGNWYKYDLNSNINKFKYKKIKCCIFLASPYYLKKNMKFKIYNKEYLWIKKIVKNFKIENLIYASSPSIYLKNHYVGKNKYKTEKFLIKNKSKFITLQIWRPFNLINTKYKKYTDHFHNLLYKIMFVEKKISFNFQGNKNDSRAYCDIDKFSNILLKNAFLKKSFIKDYGNLNSITIDEIIKIYNKYYYIKFKKFFVANFMSKKINRNIIKRNSKNNVCTKENSKNLIKKYLISKLYAKK